VEQGLKPDVDLAEFAARLNSLRKKGIGTESGTLFPQLDGLSS
jgi:hypothetical protein